MLAFSGRNGLSDTVLDGASATGAVGGMVVGAAAPELIAWPATAE